MFFRVFFVIVFVIFKIFIIFFVFFVFFVILIIFVKVVVAFFDVFGDLLFRLSLLGFLNNILFFGFFLVIIGIFHRVEITGQMHFSVSFHTESDFLLDTEIEVQGLILAAVGLQLGEDEFLFTNFSNNCSFLARGQTGI
jgi:hypothetical protein